MSDLDYDALRKVAEAAEGDGVYPDTWWGQSASKWMIAGDPWAFLPDADLAHIAAFDPPTVLRLLDLAQRAEAAEAAVERVRALAEQWRYKGEFGWGAWQEGHGPDPEGETLDYAAAQLRAALDREEDQ